MLSWFKRHFIPHHGNDHRPHFLRGANTRLVIVGILMVELVVFILPASTSLSLWKSLSNTAEVFSGALTIFTNEERIDAGVPALHINDLLTRAAELKALDMATNSYFAHTSPDGKTPWYWLDLVGYPYEYAGENLAINFNDSKDVTIAWMNSPGHRANIVKGVYAEIGTGIATGTYNGREAVFVAQVYANPYTKKTPPIVTPSIESPIPDTVEKPIENPTTDEAVLSASDMGAGVEVDSEQEEEMTIVGTEVKISLMERIIASPQHAVRVILVALLGLTVLALVLKVVVHSHRKHRDLLTNGLALVAILIGAFLLNDILSAKNVVLTQTTEYTSDASITELE